MKRRPFQGLSHVVHLGQEVVPWKIMMPKQKWVYGSRLFIVSARTNKRHHHHHQRWANFSEINPHRAVWRTRAGAKKTFTFVTNSRHFSVGVTATLIVNILVDSRHHQE
jgi:hypothetical protein